jgi:hypothetical protein
MLNGKKTYILSGLAFAYGVAGFLGGFIDAQQAGEAVFGSMIFASLRHGMK